MLVSRWCDQSGLLKVIGQFSLNGRWLPDSFKVYHRSLVGFDPSVVSQMDSLESCFSVLFTA